MQMRPSSTELARFEAEHDDFIGAPTAARPMLHGEQNEAQALGLPSERECLQLRALPVADTPAAGEQHQALVD